MIGRTQLRIALVLAASATALGCAGDSPGGPDDTTPIVGSTIAEDTTSQPRAGGGAGGGDPLVYFAREVVVVAPETPLGASASGGTGELLVFTTYDLDVPCDSVELLVTSASNHVEVELTGEPRTDCSGGEVVRVEMRGKLYPLDAGNHTVRLSYSREGEPPLIDVTQDVVVD